MGKRVFYIMNKVAVICNHAVQYIRCIGNGLFVENSGGFLDTVPFDFDTTPLRR